MKKAQRKKAGESVLLQHLPRAIFLVFLFFAFSATADKVILEHGTELIELNESLSFFRDPEGAFSIEEVSDPAFAGRFEKVGNPGFLNFGTTRDYLWFKIPIENHFSWHRWVIEVDNPRFGRAEVYTQEAGGEWEMRELGVQVKGDAREFFYSPPAFTLLIEPGTTEQIYLRLRHHGMVRFRLRLWSLVAFSNHLQRWSAYIYLIEGALIAMALYCLCVFVGLREKSYFYYALLISLFFIFNMTRDGTAHLMLWPRANWWADHAPSFVGLFVLSIAVLFAYHFLNAKQLFPRLSKLMLLTSGLCVLNAFLTLGNHKIKYPLTNALVCFVCAIVVVICLLAILKGFRPARNFFLAWSICTVGILSLLLVLPGYIPSNVFTEHFMELCFLTSLMVWSFALTGRVKVEEAEQRRILEEQVNERTAKLRKALDQVKALRGLLPICSHCKKIRDDQGYWKDVEIYIHQHTDADFSHGLCPDCAYELYPEYVKKGEFQHKEEQG